MIRNLTGTIAWASLALVVACPAFAAEISVPADHLTIQAAIIAAEDGNVVIVSPGRYKENISFLGKAVTVRSTDPDDPDVVAGTIIDGDGADSCVTFENNEGRDSVLKGFTVTNGDGDYGGGIQCFTSSPSILANVIIHNRSWQGGGIDCNSRSPLIEGNAIIENVAGNHGGGISCSTTTATISGNRIVGNVAGSGAGVVCTNGSSVITNNVIAGNVANRGSGAGCGILTDGEDVVIAGNVVVDNTRDVGLGGGIWAGPSLSLIVVANTVCDNDGQGIICDSSLAATICDNTVAGNNDNGVFVRSRKPVVVGNVVTDNGGSGMELDGRDLIAANNLVAGNRARLYAGGIHCNGQSSIIINNTVVGNRSDEGAGGILIVSSSALVENCIVTGNVSGIGAQVSAGIYGGGTPALTIRHSLIEGGQASVQLVGETILDWGPGNIDDDSRFLDPGQWDDAGTPGDVTDDTFAVGDYQLLPGSPGIDAGTNDFYADGYGQWALEPFLHEDVASLPRIIDGDLDATATADMGAYEYLPGDVNYDGKANVLDLLIVRNSLGKDPSSDPAARRADGNADGNVDIMDLIAVRNLISAW